MTIRARPKGKAEAGKHQFLQPGVLLLNQGHATTHSIGPGALQVK